MKLDTYVLPFYFLHLYVMNLLSLNEYLIFLARIFGLFSFLRSGHSLNNI